MADWETGDKEADLAWRSWQTAGNYCFGSGPVAISNRAEGTETMILFCSA